MVEFILGIVIGIAALWFPSHEKLRHEIFREKLEIYKLLQRIATDALICIIPSESINDLENQSKQITTDLFIELQRNSIIIDDNVISKGYDIWLLKFPNLSSDKKEFFEKFGSFINAMREDLKVKSLHNITTFLVGAPQLNIKHWQDKRNL